MQTGRLYDDGRVMTGCLNDDKKCTDPYLPRKCQYSGKIIDAKDKSSVQISLAPIENGLVNLGTNVQRKQIIISGFVRAKGHSNAAIQKILTQQKSYPVDF